MMVTKTRYKRRVLFLLLCSAALVGFTLRVVGEFNIPWSSINSGGQTIASDEFVIQSSIGQPAVGGIQGEGLHLESGYWVDPGPAAVERLIYLPLVVR